MQGEFPQPASSQDCSSPDTLPPQLAPQLRVGEFPHKTKFGLVLYNVSGHLEVVLELRALGPVAENGSLRGGYQAGSTRRCRT